METVKTLAGMTSLLRSLFFSKESAATQRFRILTSMVKEYCSETGEPAEFCRMYSKRLQDLSDDLKNADLEELEVSLRDMNSDILEDDAFLTLNSKQRKSARSLFRKLERSLRIAKRSTEAFKHSLSHGLPYYSNFPKAENKSAWFKHLTITNVALILLAARFAMRNETREDDPISNAIAPDITADERRRQDALDKADLRGRENRKRILGDRTLEDYAYEARVELNAGKSIWDLTNAQKISIAYVTLSSVWSLKVLASLLIVSGLIRWMGKAFGARDMNALPKATFRNSSIGSTPDFVPRQTQFSKHDANTGDSLEDAEAQDSHRLVQEIVEKARQQRQSA
jgi:hypothetical protein